MQISDVRIKLAENQADRLKAFATITFDDVFVVRDIKIVDGTNGPFVAMPSRKSTVPCRKCHQRNPVQSRYCNACAAALPPSPAPGADDSSDPRSRVHRDIAHPISTEFRELIQQRVLDAYRAAIGEFEEEDAGYDGEDPITEAEMSEYDSLIADLRGVRAARAEADEAAESRGEAPRSRGQGRGRGDRNGGREPHTGGRDRDRGPRSDARPAGPRPGPRENDRPAPAQGARPDRYGRPEQPRREGPPRQEQRPAADQRPRQEQRPRPEPRYQQDRIVPFDDDDSFGDGLPAGQAPAADRPQRQDRPAPRDDRNARQDRGPRQLQAPRSEAPAPRGPAPRQEQRPRPAPAVVPMDEEDDAFGEGLAAAQAPPQRSGRQDRPARDDRGPRQDRDGNRAPQAPRSEVAPRPAPAPPRESAPPRQEQRSRPAAVAPVNDEDDSFGDGLTVEPVKPAGRKPREQQPVGREAAPAAPRSGKEPRTSGRSGGGRGRQPAEPVAAVEPASGYDAMVEEPAAPMAPASRPRAGVSSRIQDKPARPVHVEPDRVSLKQADQLPPPSADVNEDSAPFGIGIDD
jgi:stage V sporulation protein G